MRVILFCHSIVSDWNHGNAHFLRGMVAQLEAEGTQRERFRALRILESAQFGCGPR